MNTKLKEKLTNINKKYDKRYDSFTSHLLKWGWLYLLVFVTLFAVIVRLGLFGFRSNNGDIYWFQRPWCLWIRDNGGIKSLSELPISAITYIDEHGASVHKPYSLELYNQYKESITNITRADYLPVYLVVMAIFSYLPVEAGQVCKYIALFSDLGSAIAVMFITYKLSKGNKLVTGIAYSGFLFLPTILLNSSIWGQADCMYACLVLWCVYFAISDKPWFSMLFLGLGLATKIQTLFIIPLFGYLWLSRKFKLRWLLLVPVAMLIAFIPNLVMGMNFFTIIGQYFGQAGSYPNANYNSGSFYALFYQYNSTTDMRNTVNLWGVPLCLTMLVITLFYLFFKKVEANENNILGVAALYSIMFPFFLPHMHERYFYLADVFVFLYVIKSKKHYYLIALSQFASFNACTKFIFGDFILPEATFKGFPLYLSMIANIAMMVVLLKDLFQKSNSNLEKLDNQIVNS